MSTTKIKVSNIASVTGTGNVVLSASPTFTGTTATANVSYTGTLTGSTGILNIGSGQLYKAASGNVGIGTSSPARRLHAYGTGTTIKAEGSGTNVYMQLSCNSQSNANSGYIGYDSSSNLLMLTNDTERMRIDSSGNVGIGTSSPETKLQIVGNATFGTTGIGGTVLRISTDGANGILLRADRSEASGARYLAFGTDYNERMRIDVSGNVGIGTSSPSQKLHVAGTIFAAAGVSLGAAVSEGGEIGFQSASGTNAGMIDVDGSNNWRFYNALATPTIFFTNSSERMRIDSSGNVGIGTSSPVCKLNVYSSTAQNDNYGFVQIENPTAAAGVNASYTAKNYSGTSQFMQWENYGLRIGSRIVTNTGLGNIIFTTGNDAERMRIDANGYLLKNTSAFISTSYGNGDFSLVTMSAGLVIKNPGASGAAVPTSIVFLNGAGTAVGYIAVGASVTNFTNLSDYRLKKDVTQINNALDKVSRINPVSFIWKESGEVGESFIAHELQEECPIAVVGNKDDVNEDGSIRPQGVDASKLIPLLTAAIKELKTIIDTQQEQLNIQQQQINTLLGK